MGQPRTIQSGGSPRPREILRAAERSAVRIRKLLRANTARTQGSESSWSMDDAVRLAELAEKLARYGQKVPAAEAVRFVERVETILGMLNAELNDLLAS